MQQKTITVVIDQNGDSSVDLEGFAGQGCEKALKDFQGADPAKLQRRKADFTARSATYGISALKSGS